MATFFVYGLASSADPTNIRYVGAASHLGRPLAHAAGVEREKRRTHRRDWLRKVIREGHHVVWHPLEDADSWAETLRIERAIIRTLRAAGCDLVNGNDGGFGGFNPTAATRERMSAANRDPAKRARQSSSLKLTWSDPGRGKRLRQAAALAIHTLEAHAKQAASLRETWADPGRGAKLRAALVESNREPVKRAKQSASLKNTWADAERGANLRRGVEAANTPEAHAKQSASMRARYTSDPEFKTRRAAEQAAVNRDPAKRAKQSASLKATWAAKRAARVTR